MMGGGGGGGWWVVESGRCWWWGLGRSVSYEQPIMCCCLHARQHTPPSPPPHTTIPSTTTQQHHHHQHHPPAEAREHLPEGIACQGTASDATACLRRQCLRRQCLRRRCLPACEGTMHPPLATPTMQRTEVRGIVLSAGAMEPAPKRFRTSMAGLLLENAVPASTARAVMAEACAAGAAGVGDLARAGTSGRHPGNSCRDLLRRLLKRTAWPALYFAPIPTWDPKANQERVVQLPFLLPHELLAFILQCHGALPKLLAKRTATPELFRQAEAVARELGTTSASLVPLGLHGDGVPFNSPRVRSLEFFAMNFPALQQEGPALRLPLTAVEKSFVLKGRTFHSLMAVLEWSLRMCALGLHPIRGHDGAEFAARSARARLAGKPLGAQAFLAEVRGDWAFMKGTFGLASWNEVRGNCWLCSVTPATMRETGLEAAWRQNRLSHQACLQRIRDKGETVSPLFSCPGLRTTHFKADWLHTADIGCAADTLGNAFLGVLPKLPGPNQRAQVASLFGEMQQFYRRERTHSRFDALTLEMLCQRGKSPKLRGKAAECRLLVPFAKELSERFLSRHDPHEEAVRSVAAELNECYTCLTNFNKEHLAASSRRFAALYIALEARAQGRRWRVRPKLHLFLELCSFVAAEHGSPRNYWTYRDEDFGGQMSKMARRRGGKNTAAQTPLRLLQRFCARYPRPVL